MLLCIAAFPIGSAHPVLAQTAPGQATSNTPAASGHYRWVTLGTMGGPMPTADRHQPANLLFNGKDAHLIDAGDGAASAMVSAGAYYPMLRSIWISHLHFDHIGGLSAVLGLRLQTRTTTPLVIYGPPGIREVVSNLLAAMRPSAELGFGVPGEVALDPTIGIEIIELDDGVIVHRPEFTVTVARNCHYSFPLNSGKYKSFRSLSFRFQLADRTVAYTGDTGPCEPVYRLINGADLLVSEMIDVDDTLAKARRNSPDLPPAEMAKIEEHLRRHHLTTADIGGMASRAQIGAVVVTHIAGGGDRAGIANGRYASEIGEYFSGKVTIAADGDRF